MVESEACAKSLNVCTTHIVAETGCPAEWAEAIAEASPAPAPGMSANPVVAAFAELELLLVEDALTEVALAEELMVEEGDGLERC